MLDQGNGAEVLARAMPRWVPQEAQRYLVHTESGASIRALARAAGCHASTILRQVRKVETRRDDLLIDEALSALGRFHDSTPVPDLAPQSRNSIDMTSSRPTAGTTGGQALPDDGTIEREARRVLRRLCEPGACLAVARDMEKAVVVRDLPDGRTARTAVIDRPVAQALALKEWIAAGAQGRITRYTITTASRAALKRMLAEDAAARPGFAEAPAVFAALPGTAPQEGAAPEARPRRARYNPAESPVSILSRRRDKDGAPFLAPDLVAVAERLRGDFELAQMGPRVTQNWDHFLTAGARGTVGGSREGFGPEAARARVAAALAALGPGLGDVALRCCCHLEGLEETERRMGWSARSGKIVLRIALQRLALHYHEAGYSNLIG